MVRHLRHQPIDLRRGDVGRVAQEKIKAAGQGAGPIAADESRPISQVQHRRIVSGKPGCRRGAVDTDTERSAEFRECRQQEAAGAGAQVQDQRGRRPMGKGDEGGLDQGFRFGTRDQGRGRYRKVEAPELTVAEDQRERLVREAADQQRFERGWVGLCGPALQQGGGCGAQRMGQQQASLQMGTVDPRGAKPLGSLIDRLLDGSRG